MLGSLVTARLVILLGSEEIQHRYVASRLAEIPNCAIVIASQPKSPIFKKIARANKRYGPLTFLSRVLLKIALRVFGVAKSRDQDLVRVLGNPEIPKTVPLFKTTGVNSEETRRVLKNLQPRVLCVYGTYIVSDETLSIAPTALNLHTGISPRYRGADCYFWPIHNAEPKWVGATVHACTKDVDGGDIFETARATLRPADGIGAIFGRSVIVGAEIYRSTADALLAGKPISCQPQNLKDGFEYKVKMRGWGAELRVALLLWRGLIRTADL
jgi:methionyl-tRNA formyltransferase